MLSADDIAAILEGDVLPDDFDARQDEIARQICYLTAKGMR